MKLFATLLTVAVGALGGLAGNVAEAQVVTYDRPALVGAPIVQPYYAPAPVAVYRPVVVARPAPVRTVSYYAPPVVVKPAAPAVVYEPTVRVRTRYRPILGGTVTRVDGGYAPSRYPIVRY